MTISGPDLPKAESLEETSTASLWRSQRKAILAWVLALPFGWLLGWAIGAAVGYTNPALLNRVPTMMNWDLAQKIGASDGGLRGGAIGILLGLMAASWITISALRPAITALKPLQVTLVLLSWTLPWVLCIFAAHFLDFGF